MEKQEQIQRRQEQKRKNALQKLGLLVVLFSILITGVVVLSGQRQNKSLLCSTAANGGYNYQQAAYNIGVAEVQGQLQ